MRWLLPLALFACSSNEEATPPPAPVAGACAAFRKTAPPTPVSTTCKLPVSGSGNVRVFAAGNRQDIAKNNTYEAFCESIDRVMREQIAPCLAKDKPNLVVWPEDAILAAAFIGARGDKARKKTIADAAFLDLAGAYSKQIVHYQQQFEALPAGRNLTLALTDVSYRVLYGVFAEQAKYYGVHVAVGANVAEAREVTDAALRAKLGDPEVTEGPVYEAASSDVFNVGMVFDDKGKIAGVDRKAYLTPPEEDVLNLSYGALPQLDPLDLPFARISAAISKDAWMPPVRDRFDAWGTDVVLQYEAFSGWAVEERPGDWNPDVFMESGYFMTARAGSVRYVATPCLTGNILDLVFDCQSHITKQPAPGDAPLAFIGNPALPGFSSMGPWAAAGNLSRADLRAYGETLKQGGSRENLYAESVAVADLDIHRDGKYPAIAGAGVPGVLGASSIVSPAEVPQRHVAVAAHGDAVALAWEEGSDVVVGFQRTELRLTRFSGARLPAVAFDGTGRVAVAFEKGDRVHLAIGDSNGSIGMPKTVAGTAAQWMPSLAGGPSSFYVAWADLRDGGRPHVYLAGEDLAPVRVDGKHLNTDKPTRGDEWSPRIAADDTGVHVVWTDFRDYSWDIRYARSTDLGKTFSDSVRVNDPAKRAGDVELERLHADPTIAVSGGAALVAWTALQDRLPLPWTAWDVIADGKPGTDTRIGWAKPSSCAGVPDHWCEAKSFVQPDAVATPDGRMVGVHDSMVVLFTSARPDAPISDAPRAAHASRPRMATLADSTMVIAWQDDRAGMTKIRWVRGKL